MNLRLMSLNIKQFVPDLSIPVIKQRINIRYKQILAAENWEFLNDSTTVTLKGIHSSLSGETIAISQAGTTITGTGTTFTEASVGYKFRIGSESQPYIIRYIASDTSLDFETAYGGTTQTAGAYSYFKNVYTPTVGDVGEIRSIVYQSPLKEVSLEHLNKIDPERNSTGEPKYWRNASKTSAADGIVSFEIWPVADQDYVVTVFYKKAISDLSADTDSPIFRHEVLEAGALWDCYRLVFAITQNPAYIGLARDARTDFADLTRDMFREDIETSSISHAIRDVTAPIGIDNNYWIDHDTESW